ncbi:hypothetical protein [Parasphingorhabdus sp.]|uniref:hypothetical protein n=1 Tax=Parasphingorhabdus sp. TaxID=2709688 RepID=UPI003C74BA73
MTFFSNRTKCPLFVLLALALPGCMNGPDLEPAIGPAPRPEIGSVEQTRSSATIILLATGVRFERDETVKRIEFGSTRQQVIAELIIDGGQFNLAKNDECGAGPMVFLDIAAHDLILHFQDNRFVGWFLDGSVTKLKTEDGIGIGSRRRELELAPPFEIQKNSTLGIEFFASRPDDGFIGGFLSDESENAVVESLYSGTTCFFR